MTTRTYTLGQTGETYAAQWLQKRGYAILERNWRAAYPMRGEIDIIARDGATLVIVEVKTRTTQHCGHPSEAVTPRKLTQLRRLAAAWLTHAGVRPRELRFDVISVLAPSDRYATPTNEWHIDHLKDVRP